MSECVRMEDKTFFVDSYETTDEDIVSYFSEIPPENMEERFTTALRIGVVALRTLGTTERIDYIEKEFNKLEQVFDENLAKTIESIESQVNEIFGEEGSLLKTMEEYLGKEGVLPSTIDEVLGEEGTLVKDVFDPTKEASPLYRLKSSIIEEINRLRTDLKIGEAVEKAVGEVVERTPLKGYEFEDLCEGVLSDIVRTRLGDELVRTTDTTGRKRGSKKGDFVITLNERPDCRVVLETKDVGRITLPVIHETMEESIENREAVYGIFVSKRVDSLPKSVGCFNEYGNHLVCALSTEEDGGNIHPEILHIAVCWARNRALLETVRAEGIDVPLIQGRLEEIQLKLNKFESVRRECTNAEKAVSQIRIVCQEIQDEIATELGGIRAELTRAIEESA